MVKYRISNTSKDVSLTVPVVLANGEATSIGIVPRAKNVSLPRGSVVDPNWLAVHKKMVIVSKVEDDKQVTQREVSNADQSSDDQPSKDDNEE